MMSENRIYDPKQMESLRAMYFRDWTCKPEIQKAGQIKHKSGRKKMEQMTKKIKRDAVLLVLTK